MEKPSKLRVFLKDNEGYFEYENVDHFSIDSKDMFLIYFDNLKRKDTFPRESVKMIRFWR